MNESFLVKKGTITEVSKRLDKLLYEKLIVEGKYLRTVGSKPNVSVYHRTVKYFWKYSLSTKIETVTAGTNIYYNSQVGVSTWGYLIIFLLIIGIISSPVAILFGIYIWYACANVEKELNKVVKSYIEGEFS
ncbi:MAG: hypothetical protein WC506_00745 [Candidatus Micrarchaeia archaeon]